MVKGLKIGAVAALVIALTSCSNSTDTTAHSTEPVGFANVETDTTPTPEPLVAETPDKSAADADETFIKYVREELPAKTSIPNATDEQLIAAGHDACEQIASGTAYEDVRVVEGEQPQNGGYYLDTSAIMSGAIIAYCPVD